MELGMIGLGRMGNGMTERLREAGHELRTYDPQVESRTASSHSFEAIVTNLAIFLSRTGGYAHSGLASP